MKKRNIFNLIYKLLKLVDSFVVVIFLAVINGTLGFILSMAITTLAGVAIVELIQTGEIAIWLYVTIAVSGVLRGLLRYIEQYSNHYIAFKILAILRSKIFKQLRKLSPSKLEGKNKGDIIAMVQGDIETLEVFYAHTISPFLIAVFTSLTVIIFIGCMTNWWLALLAFVAYLIIGGLIPVIYYLSNKKEGQKYRVDLANFESFYLDSIYGGYEIIASNNQNKTISNLNKQSDKLIKTADKLESKNSLFKNITNVFIVVLNILMIGLAGYLAYLNLMDSAYIIIAFISFTSSFGSVLALANLPSNLTMTFASGNRVLDLLEEEPLVKENKTSEPISFNNLEVSHLQFGYNNELVLNDINFTVKQNEIIGLLGPSGCGKSTILKLLMKFYPTKDGQIKYNGINISELNQKDLYETINLFSQDTYLFKGSIKDNLLIANPNASEQDLIKACENASIMDYINNLSSGFDTQISDLKDNLSSGEKQRLGLARVFLKKPKLLLLDEATANIDAINEGIILNALKKYKQDMSIIIISHRKSTLAICDKTYEIKEGTCYGS